MNELTAIEKVRDTLRTNLTDPRLTAGGEARNANNVHWIYADEPILSNKFPLIQLKKFNNPTEPISIGSSYTEFEELYIIIWFSTKNGFAITVSGTEYTNASLVSYYQSLIKTTLKGKFSTLFSDGVKGYKHVSTSTIEYDPTTQLYFGNVICRVFYFNQ